VSQAGDANREPNFELLIDWLDGRLSEDRSEEARDRVAKASSATQVTVQWLRQFQRLARALPLYETPPVVKQRLQRHFLLWSRARAELAQTAVEQTAVLLFDSRLDLAGAGVRGVGDYEDAAHLAYTSERADLVLDISRHSGGRVQIDGQVLPNGEGEAPVFEAMVSGPHGVERTVDGDELGRFCLPSVHEDATELRVTNGDFTIVAGIDLRGPEPQG
jgi:hypothetical protein